MLRIMKENEEQGNKRQEDGKEKKDEKTAEKGGNKEKGS